ncbi:MAG: hypothetical protein H6703_06645 [Myxococcales bacterium]|nr:hypothetical protein [Myxococcales bacterium]
MWGDHLLVERLGAGGVGTVYGAIKPPIMMQAAVKILSAEAPAALVERFRQEAVALARPIIPTSFGCCTSGTTTPCPTS